MTAKTKLYPLVLFVCLSLSVHSFARGEDAVEAETAALRQSLEQKASVLLSSPAGVFDVETRDGRIVRLKIKGEADVPTSMRGSRGDRFAREKANRDARAAFTKYLGESVIFSESEFEGVVIHEKNGRESSEVLNASAKLYGSFSAAMLKGLIVLMDRVEGEGDRRVCTVVLGWSRRLSDAANTARADMSRTAPESSDVRKSPATRTPSQKSERNTETVTRMGDIDCF